MCEKTPIDKINEKCKECNIEFLGFDNEENSYKNWYTKLKLRCKKCGYTWNTTDYGKFVSRKSPCMKCLGKTKMSDEERIDKINKKCKELDYTFLGFVGNETNSSVKLKLKCNKCGVEWNTTSFYNFLKPGRKSHKCYRNNPSYMPPVSLSDEKAIEKINKKLTGTNLEFDSFKEGGFIGYKNSHILLKCKLCGKITEYNFLYFLYKSALQCRHCEYNGKTQNNEAIDSINEKCKLLDYTFLGFNNTENIYNGKNTRLILKCNKCGYIWKTTTYFNFVHMVIKCRGCTNSWKMEQEIRYILKKNNIQYEEQKRFDWLRNKISLSLDFYLPEYHIAIECQGRQHFQPVEKFGGDDGFKLTKQRDIIKKRLCEENRILLLYYSTTKQAKDIPNIIKTEDELLNKIYKNG